MTLEEKMKIVINNYFEKECSVNTSIREAFEKGFRIGVKKGQSAQPERIKGRWIYHPEIGWGETWLCDQCGEKTSSTVMGKPRANFCPNCGAEMRGEP